MGSFAHTIGTVQVKDCPEVQAILKELDDLVESLEEGQVARKKIASPAGEQSTLEIDIDAYGRTHASHAIAIEDKARELGPYAIEAGKFESEWDYEWQLFFVGTDEQVALAESADALKHIKERAPKLIGDDVATALRLMIDRAEESSGIA